jgi:hypothetical protein
MTYSVKTEFVFEALPFIKEKASKLSNDRESGSHLNFQRQDEAPSAMHETCSMSMLADLTSVLKHESHDLHPALIALFSAS